MKKLKILTLTSVVALAVMGCDSEKEQTEYDTSRLYYLPYEAGQTTRVTQGYMGETSHINAYALDFFMMVGTKVLAARGGTVTGVVENINSLCAIEDNCPANYIEITHNDGSTGTYGHLKLDGACVVLGDQVAQGDLIGLSGATGRTNGPHLDFHVKPGTATNFSPPTFVDVDADGTGIPTSPGVYTSSNAYGVNDWCALRSVDVPPQGVIIEDLKDYETSTDS